MKKYKVMIVVPSAHVKGGGDVWLSELVKALVPIQISLIVIFENNGELINIVQSAGHKVYVLTNKPQESKSFLRLALSLSKVIRLEQPDAVIHWSPRAQVYGTLAQKIAFTHTRVGWIQHVIPSRFWLHRAASFCPSNIVICVSTSVAKKQKLLYPKTQPVVLHPGISHKNNGLDKHKILDELGIDGNQYIVGSLARIEPWKGQDILISSVGMLRSQGLPVHAILVGEENSLTWPDFSNQVHKLISQGSLVSNITFTGHLNDVQRIIMAFDVFVCSSREEGFGISIIDAMASGIPVVATRCGGPEDIIEHERNGLLVKQEDPVALAAAIQRINEDSSLVHKIIKEGKITYQERFTATHSAASFLNVIHKLIAL